MADDRHPDMADEMPRVATFPMLVVSALTPDEQTARRAKALRWIAQRGETIARSEAAQEANAAT